MYGGDVLDVAVIENPTVGRDDRDPRS